MFFLTKVTFSYILLFILADANHSNLLIEVI